MLNNYIRERRKSCYTSRDISSFVTNSTIVVLESGNDENCALSMYSIKERKYLATSLTFREDYLDSLGKYCRLRCSPDGRLIMLNFDYIYDTGAGNIIFFKVILPSEVDSNYYLNMFDSYSGWHSLDACHDVHFLAKRDGLL